MLDRTATEHNVLAMAPADRMPREIASGVFWIGDCLLQRHKGKVYHGYNAAFLVAGDDASILVETGPWMVTEADNDATSPHDLRSFMLNTRYWWLEGAPTDSIRRGIGNVFDTYEVETIAPGYGCILRGRNVVARHYRMLDEILKGLDRSVAVSRYVGRDEER